MTENNNDSKKLVEENVPIAESVVAVVGTAKQDNQPEVGTFEYRKLVVDDYIRMSDQHLIGIIPRPKDKVLRKIYDHHRPVLHLTTMVYTRTNLPAEQKQGIIDKIYEEYQIMHNNDFITKIEPTELSEVKTKLNGLEQRAARDHFLLKWIALWIKAQIRLIKAQRGISN